MTTTLWLTAPTMVKKPVHTTTPIKVHIDDFVQKLQHEVSGPLIRRKAVLQQTADFDARLERDGPDFATLMASMYQLASKMVVTLNNKEEYSSRDITSLTALTKALPVLQAAEKAHKAKIKDKAVEDLSTEELMEALGIRSALPLGKG